MTATLAFDTALNGCSVGLHDARSGEVYARYRPMARGQSEQLMPEIAALLQEAGVTYPDIGALVTTAGPGAFAGLRIGLAAAKGMALALGVPVLTMTTLQALAWHCADQQSLRVPFLVVLETKREDFYVQAFDAAGSALSPAAAMDAQAAADLARELSLSAAVGDAVERLCATYPALLESLRERLLYDHIPGGWLAAQRARCSESTVPVYLRAPDVTYSTRPQRSLQT